jgi:hypothetical protein
VVARGRSLYCADMNDEFTWWFLLVGLTIGVAVTWFVRGTLARSEDDVAVEERGVEAEWISETIERAGGIAPAALVGQVLELHRHYLRAAPFEINEQTSERPGESGIVRPG